MDPYKNALDHYAADTTPSEAELVRYNHLVDRVARGERKAEAGIPWMGWGLGFGALAAAAAALLLVTSGPSRSDPLSYSVGDDAPLQVALTEHVEMQSEGVGEISGTRGAPVYQLESGKVLFSVTPEQGIDLRVHTEEAEVRVLGTVFSVERTDLGTEVKVQEGTVWVKCKGPNGQEPTLVAGMSDTCKPVTAERWANRAMQLEKTGGSPEALSEAIAAALAGGITGENKGHVLAMRMESAMARQEYLSALADAKSILDAGFQDTRKDALKYAALLSFNTAQTCEAALPYMELLEQEGHEVPADLAAACPR
ncbi:MAG: FecR domain-containing protein [Alphaproteobacteria bacterium]|nr:FecR domain-containing protein [Alphaproteobacteria bacterium]